MGHNHRHTRMGIHIETLCIGVHIIHIFQNSVYMCFDCIKCVLEVLVLVLLLCALVVTLYCDEVCLGGSGVVVDQDFVQEEIPNLDKREI